MAVAARSPHTHGRSEIWERAQIVRAVRAEQRQLAARLKALRVERGLTQEEAAERAGLAGRQVQRIESGAARNVSLASLVALSLAYGIRVRDLFGE